MKFRVVFLYQGRVSVFPGVVLRINSFLSWAIGLRILNGWSAWQEETLPQSLFLGNFSQMIIHLNGSIFTPEKDLPQIMNLVFILHRNYLT